MGLPACPGRRGKDGVTGEQGRGWGGRKGQWVVWDRAVGGRGWGGEQQRMGRWAAGDGEVGSRGWGDALWGRGSGPAPCPGDPRCPPQPRARSPCRAPCGRQLRGSPGRLSVRRTGIFRAPGGAQRSESPSVRGTPGTTTPPGRGSAGLCGVVGAVGTPGARAGAGAGAGAGAAPVRAPPGWRCRGARRAGGRWGGGSGSRRHPP